MIKNIVTTNGALKTATTFTVLINRCALTAIIQSVAMIEASLSSIICVEAMKLKKAVCLANDLDSLIRINESVQENT